MSKQVILTSQAQAEKLSKDVDAYCRLPWSGIEHDTGRIVPNQTLRMADIVPSKDGKKFAYQDLIQIKENGKPDKVSVPKDAVFVDALDIAEFGPSEVTVQTLTSDKLKEVSS